HPRGGVVDHAVDAGDVANHVVVEDRLDAPAVGDGVPGEDLAAVQALLLARQRGVDDGAGELVLRQHPGRFQRAGDTGGVVVRARRVGGRIHDIGDPRVDVAAHDYVPAGVAAAALDRDHADNLHRVGHAGFAGHHIADVAHFQAATAL